MMRGLRRVWLSALLVSAVLWIGAPFARSESAEADALRQEIRDLKEMVQRLMEKVDSLEQRLQSQPAPSSQEIQTLPSPGSRAASTADEQATTAIKPAPPAAAKAGKEEAKASKTEASPAPETQSPPPAGGKQLTAAEAPQSAAKEVTIRDRWRQIKRGLTEGQVETLLGRPARIMKIDDQLVWYYTYPGVGAGSVVFLQDGQVEDWQRPPFPGWWFSLKP